MDPVADTTAATALGDALRAVGYSQAAVVRLLGEEAYSGEEETEVSERRLPRTELGTVVRALFLQLPVPRRDAVRALGRRAVDALAATALAAVDEEVAARVRILPVGSLFVASDDFPDGDGENEPDYVAAYTPTTRLVDLLTPRRRVARALDVGTGSGIQALLAARHAQQVVATDLNERGLGYTALNAALNGLTNIECRGGSLFEPVEGERFDLITCNAPYVVSPEHRWKYRDAGFQGDELSERVVHEAADHLAEGGFATLLVSWVAHDEDDPDERPLAWAEAIECDAWILPIWESDALGHAATWNDHLVDEPEEFGAALDTWTQYLARLRAEWVTEGAIVLHRRRGRRHTTRVDMVDDETLEEAGDQIQRAFASRARLAELGRGDELLDARLATAAPLRLEHELAPRRGRTAVVAASLQLAGGTQSTVEGTPRAVELAATLDGRASLGHVVQAAAARLGLSDTETSRLRREVLAVTRELLELGALRFAS